MSKLATTQKQKVQFSLDDSLRNMLYSTLRNKGCLFMAIELEYKGKKFRVDTIAEAVELQHQLDVHESLNGTFHREKSPRVWTADLAMDLINGLGTKQRQFLAELASMGLSRKRSTTLVEKLGLESEIALAGVVSGLSKQLRKMAIDPANLYRVEVEWKGKGKERSFVLSSDFKDAANELGWPEAWQPGKVQAK